MVVNDTAGSLAPCEVLTTIASKLAPTVGQGMRERKKPATHYRTDDGDR